MNKVAIVTGASGNGIGRSAAFTLARDGFDVVINYRTNKKQAESVCSHISQTGGKAICIKADIFSQEQCDLLVNKTIFAFNRIDVCIIGPGADWNPEPPDKINPTNSLNDVIQEVSPIYYLIPRLIPEMNKIGGGRIVGIASNPKLPSPSYSYNVAKNSRINALLGLVDPCWEKRITVNILAPGSIDHFSNEDIAKQEAEYFGKNSIKISPQDVAEAISFICSEKGRYLTGNVLCYQF